MNTILLRWVFCVVIALPGVGTASAQFPTDRLQDTARLTDLHSFNGTDGIEPGKLVQASDGNFYGITTSGGPAYVENGDRITGKGTIYRLTPSGVFTTLYNFTGGDDGSVPQGLIQAADGNLYGATVRDGSQGRGTLFRITLAGEFSTVHTFDSTLYPRGPVLQGGDGTLYGATDSDTHTDFGSVYSYSPASGVFTILYRFTGGNDGQAPRALAFGGDGNLYGVTGIGGTTQPDGIFFYGTVFRLTPAGELTTIHRFTGGEEGIYPSNFVAGNDGNFYGTCDGGGPSPLNYGAVYRITPAGQLTLVHAFTAGSDGKYPQPLILGNDGNLYGATTNSISATETPALATIFRITPDGKLTTLYAAAPSSQNILVGGLCQVRDGTLYGTLIGSDLRGVLLKGSVFKLKVASHPRFFAGQVPMGSDVLYLGFEGSGYFGYYTFLDDPDYLYHFDLGFEYVIDANDGNGGVYLYDFASNGFFYTSSTFPFPYLYDFNLASLVYYFPSPDRPGHYNTDGVRYFFKFNTGAIISK